MNMGEKSVQMNQAQMPKGDRKHGDYKEFEGKKKRISWKAVGISHRITGQAEQAGLGCKKQRALSLQNLQKPKGHVFSSAAIKFAGAIYFPSLRYIHSEFEVSGETT